MNKKLTSTLGICTLGLAAIVGASNSPSLHAVFGQNEGPGGKAAEKKGIQVRPSSKFSVDPMHMGQWLMAGGATRIESINFLQRGMMHIPAAENTADLPVLYGLNDLDGSWQTLSPLPGRVFAFHAAAVPEMMPVSPIDLERPMAAVYAKGKFYLFFNSQETDENWNIIYITSAKVYDADTWELLNEIDLGARENMELYFRQVAAYDEETNKIYLATWGDGKPTIVLDPDTFEYTKLPGANKFVQTFFFDGKGDLYGITYNEKKLYKIDKTSGEYTEIGELTLPFSITADVMSAVYDPTVDKVYWIAVHNNSKESFIYTVNVENAEVELVGQLPGNEHIMALYQPYTEKDAPGPASEITYSEGSLFFKAPTTTHNTGVALEGDLTTVVDCDGAQIESLTVKPGEIVSLPLNLDKGKHYIKINLKNGKGISAERRFNTYIGEDIPTAVGELSLTADDAKTLQLTWTAPAVSVNGGAIDDAHINYRVVRMPDEVVVADNLKDTFFTEAIPEAHNRYYYIVTAKTSDRDGESARSNIVTAGDIWFVPYNEEFATQEDFDSFTVIDNNQDGQTWTHMLPYGAETGSAYLHGNGTANVDTGIYDGNGNDDYLITPFISLNKGIDYQVNFKTDDHLLTNEHLTILLGKDKKVNGAEETLFTEDIHGMTDYSFIFSVPEDGRYTLLLHGDTPGESVNVSINNLGIAIFSAFEAPDAVTDVQATAGAYGALENTLSFTAPTVAYNGNNLSEISYINVYRNGSSRPVKVFESPKPGESLQWTDTELAAGSVTYNVVPFNSYGQGKMATVTNWVGLDIPEVVKNVKIRMNEDLKPVITFDKVSGIGSHGGYVVPDDVTYALFRYNEWNWENHWEQATEFTDETTITDESYVSYYGQEWVDYLVVASNSAGQSEGSGTGTVLGEPYGRPYTESFSWGFINNGPWTISANSYNYAWNAVTGSGLSAKPYDNDEGMLQFAYKGEDSNTQVLMGPRISLLDSSTPELSYFMTHSFEAEEEDLILKVYLNYEDEGWVLSQEVAYNDGTTGWGRHSLALRNDARDVQIAFGAYAADASAAIYLDAVTVDEGTVSDICVENIAISKKRIDAGDSSEVSVTVANYGMQTAKEFEVKLFNNDEVYATRVLSDLAPNSKQKAVFEVSTTRSDASKSFSFTAEASMNGDSNAENNVSGVVSLYVKGSKLPGATNLTGEANGADVTLFWEAPETFEINDPAEDDFEAYETFIIDGIGDWATYDGDGTPTAYFGGPEVPHAYEAKAWQVWAPEEAGFSIEKFDVLTPHSGNKYLTCWAASNGIDSTLPNDDWLISPEVVGGTDVSFWYRMPNAGSDPQIFEMLYSTTDREPESFVAFDSDGISFGTDWVLFEFTLPEDALYFAIRSCSTGAYTVALLDDITYTPLYGSTSELTLEGYNVYRDNELIADSVKDLTYTDKNGNDVSHTYHVTALWKEGESNYSNGVDVKTTGIVNEFSTAVKISSANGKIYVKNVGRKFVEVFTPQGVRVFGASVADSREIEVASGIYIVEIDGKSFKIVVK